MADPVKLAPRHHHAQDSETRRLAKEAREAAAAGNAPPAAEPPAVPAAPQATIVPPGEPAAPATPTTPPAASQTPMFADPNEPPAPPQKSARELELEQELLQEREKNGQLTAAQQQQLALAQQNSEELAELRQLRERLEMDKLTSLDGIELESLDPAVAQELGQKVFRPLAERINKNFETRLNVTEQQLAAERAERAQLESQLSERDLAARRGAVNSKIFTAHPDFENIRQSPEFATYMQTKVRGGSQLTLGTLMANEYHNGNADFVISAVNEFKQGRPSLENIASAPSTTTATQPAGNDDTPEYTQADLTEWNRQVATGEMTREEYKTKRQAYKAARAADMNAS